MKENVSGCFFSEYSVVSNRKLQIQTSWQPGLATSFQLVRLVGCGLYLAWFASFQVWCEWYTVAAGSSRNTQPRPAAVVDWEPAYEMWTWPLK